MPTPKLRIVSISDTHNAAPGEGYTLPKGDILIHAGDLTNQGTPKELHKALAWLRKADFAVKIIVAGNHDLALDENFSPANEETTNLRRLLRAGDSSITYLEHESATFTIRGMTFKVFGSPYSPAFASNPNESKKPWAFQYASSQASKLWSAIPPDTTILVTHTPPAGHQDASAHWTQGGCAALCNALERVRPRLHVCGHCHEGRGGRIVRWSGNGRAESDLQQQQDEVTQWQDPGAGNKRQSLFDLTSSRSGYGLQAGVQTAVVNASILAKSHGRGGKAFNKPIVVDLELPAEHEHEESSETQQ